MLSAFTARPIIELKQRDKSKIESILAYGDRVLVGLNTGSLRVYRLNELPPPTSQPVKPPNGNKPGQKVEAAQTDSEPSSQESAQVGSDTRPVSSIQPGPKPKSTDLLSEVDKFSSKAIEQLAIIKEANILVSLSNYAVALHDLQTFEPIEAPLPRTKNASTFAVTSNLVKDPTTGIHEIISRLAIAVKRRLLLWSWHESELSPDVDEIVLSEAIRSITWASATRVVCGMNSGYVTVDVTTQAVEDVVGPGAIGNVSGSQSRFGAVSNAGMGYMGLGGYIPKPLATKLADGQILLAKDINTLFVDDNGKALEKRQIPWQGAPESVGYSYPYIIALQPPAKGGLEVRNPDTLNLLQTISLAGAAALSFPPPNPSLAHAGKNFHVRSDRIVWKMDATDYDSQVEELVKTGKFDEAISLLNMLEDALLKSKTETLREVKMLKAEKLFQKKRYRESMDLFNEDEVHAPPERVLKLFPRIIAGELTGVPDKEPESEEEDGKIHENGEKKGTEPSEMSSPQKGGTFTKYLIGHRKPQPDTASIASSKRDEDAAGAQAAKAAEDLAQEEKDLMAAVLELNGYLVGARTRLQRVLDPETAKLRPRRTQSGNTEEAFQTLITSADTEEEGELEKELQNTFRIVDTALCRAYMYSRPALASSLFRIPNFCDPDVVNERLLENNRYHELVDFFYGKRLHRQALELLYRFGSPEQPDEAAPTLHGPQRTVMYLQTLPPEMIDLILEFSRWTLEKDPKLAMEVFLADSENAETLPRDKVLQFLAGLDQALEVQYLEHIIIELNDKSPDFHNRLVTLYIQRLKESSRGEEWNATMTKLVQFLRDSGKYKYSLSKAFALIPKDDPAFYEAQAVILSNMGQHKQALEIYVFKMEDYVKAEEYCNRIYMMQDSVPDFSVQTQAEGSQEQDSELSIYHTLLSLYLTPPPSHSQNFDAALDLLSKHGSRLPATSTLALVPDSLPIAKLESYFVGRMRSANSVVNESRVRMGLCKTQLVANQAMLLLGDGIPGGQGGRNRRVLVGEERVCGVCHKRLGPSVVAALADNTVVHYGCLNRAPLRGVGGGMAPALGAWGQVGNKA